MKNISCMDMGVNCPFVAEGETAEDAVMNLTAHATTAHPEEVSKMTPEEMKEAMMAKVKDVMPPAEETPAAPTV
jgi:predicted small metal-binding protein